MTRAEQPALPGLEAARPPPAAPMREVVDHVILPEGGRRHVLSCGHVVAVLGFFQVNWRRRACPECPKERP